MTPYSLIWSTVPNREIGATIASDLVDKQLAACVNLLPGVTSIYSWQEKIEQETEVMLIIKTRKDLVEQVINKIETFHPYEVPEIIATPIEAGLPAYLDWIKGCTRKAET